MDSSRFDALTKTLTTRQPRRAALTLLAALGLGLVSSETCAAKKNGEKKVRVCTCSGADASTCTTQKKAKDTVKKLLRRNPCAYKGRCIGVSGCATLTPVTPDLVAPNPGFQCTNNNDCTGGLVCIGQTCQ